MRGFYLTLLVILLCGCSAVPLKEKQATEQPDHNAAEVSKEKTIQRTDEPLEDLLDEVDLLEKMDEVCQELSIEMTKAYLEPNQKRPSIVSYCQHNGDVSLENETSWLGMANFDESTKEWKTDIVKNESYAHPNKFVGKLQLDNGVERVVVELHEQVASGGSTGILVLSSSDDRLKVERVDSTVTQYGRVHVKGNQLMIEDGHTVETYTYRKDDVIYTEKLKNTSTKADLVITYNKENDADPLTADIPSGEVLQVKPGDVIKFTPTKPLSLFGFQIRTSMKEKEDEPGAYIVSESDLGETLEFGENPFDHMIVYKIGDPKWFASHKFLNELKKGQMPGSNVQLSNSNKEIAQLMKDEFQISEFGEAGAKHLEYDKFIYAVPYLEEDGDKIYAIIRRMPYESALTGDDFIRSWGEPDGQWEEPDFDPPAMTLNYEFSSGYLVRLNLEKNFTSSRVVSISLFAKSEE